MKRLNALQTINNNYEGVTLGFYIAFNTGQSEASEGYV